MRLPEKIKFGDTKEEAVMINLNQFINYGGDLLKLRSYSLRVAQQEHKDIVDYDPKVYENKHGHKMMNLTFEDGTTRAYALIYILTYITVKTIYTY